MYMEKYTTALGRTWVCMQYTQVPPSAILYYLPSIQKHNEQFYNLQLLLVTTFRDFGVKLIKK